MTNHEVLRRSGASDAPYTVARIHLMFSQRSRPLHLRDERRSGVDRTVRAMVRRRSLLTIAALIGASAVLTINPPVTTATANKQFDLTYRGSYDPTTRGAEIVTVDPASRRMFIAAGNRIDIVDISDITAPVLVTSVSTAPYGSDVTSVSVRNGVVAAASINSVKENPGKVVFFDLDGEFLSSVDVGAVPDMVAHSPDGTKLAVANEGEPRCEGTSYVDPEGSISIIDLSGPATEYDNADVAFAMFDAYDGREDDLRADDIRIFGPGADASHDLEPESVTFAPNGRTLYSSLQENNALATIDVATATVTSITSFGYKDHFVAGNGLDPSDRDGSGNNPGLSPNIGNWPVMGMYQPDTIDAFHSQGSTFIATANEGDSRGDYGACGGNEEARGSDLAAAGYSITGQPADLLTNNDKLSRIQGTNKFPLPVPGAVPSMYAFGARSLSIWNADTGSQVFDSGDFIERHIAALAPTVFNANFGKSVAEGYDTRSDNKGPEPEGLVVGKFDGRTLVFVGLERANGIMFWDATDPSEPAFQEWERQVAYGATPTGDLAPEGLTFVPAEQSWTGAPLVIVAHEADQPGGALQTRTSIYELSVTTRGNR
jgi:2',3'-cyclic-nucleotide 2'-phosphodiesterase / 3'-nucleotidase / 5'-nucleotidase